MTAQFWVCFFLAVSALSLIVAFNFARAMAFLNRRYRTAAALMGVLLLPACAGAQEAAGGEASLKLPDLSVVSHFGLSGPALLMIGLAFCVLGLIFGLGILVQLKNMPVHKSMREMSELIYETCKTYLITQGKFIMLLWVFIAVIISLYFGWLAPVGNVAVTLPIILFFSLIGIAGSYGVAWFGIRVNTFANSRVAFAGLKGKPYPLFAIPLKAGMSVGMMLIS
ncbi:MAG: sodium/proton-translocating pyrophosphatase, partial [Terracidiphilus sp.]